MVEAIYVSLKEQHLHNWQRDDIADVVGGCSLSVNAKMAAMRDLEAAVQATALRSSPV